MLTLAGGALRLHMKEDGTEVVLEDVARQARWRLDESSRLAARGLARSDHGAFRAGAAGREGNAALLGPGNAEKVNESTIRAVHRSLRGSVVLRWVMERDRLRVLAEPEGEATALSLPGTFLPEGEGDFLAAVPLGQGILHTGKGPEFYRTLFGHGHGGGFTLAMFGQMAPRGGLLSIGETNLDAMIAWEKCGDGKLRLMWCQLPSMGTLSYTREAVVLPTAPDLASLCKRYRRYVMEKGRFKSWAEKIGERPALVKLFGAAIVFLGYHHDPELDYASSFRQLKRMGIDSAYVYPVYLESTLDLTDAIGARNIDIREHLPLLHELGYMAGSFIYIMDGPMGEGGDALRDLALSPEGKPQLLWTIKDAKWYAYSAEKRSEWARRLLDDEHGGLDGMHYDVLCCSGMREDYHPEHRADARSDAEARQELLQYAASKGLIVSSEGFWDAMTPCYDLASTKYAHALGGEEYCVVPMTMLVFHDSVVHMWWEVDNYNNPEHRTQSGRGIRPRLHWGGGFARLQSAMDALLGAPPDLFPFGLQYNYVPHNHPSIYTYRFRLGDECVREAIEYAKPVMALHKRVGALEMVDHKLHRPDGAVQETVFSDGTRVIANFANVALDAPDGTRLEPESWRSL